LTVEKCDREERNKLYISDDTSRVYTNLPVIQEDRMPRNPVKLNGFYMYHQV